MISWDHELVKVAFSIEGINDGHSNVSDWDSSNVEFVKHSQILGAIDELFFILRLQEGQMLLASFVCVCFFIKADVT